MPEKAQAVLFSTARFKSLYGGRGSAKSYCVADLLLVMAANQRLRILCARETQTSIKDSVHKLLCDRIDELHLKEFYTITKDTIVSAVGSEFIFKGLLRNISEIKSTEGIDYCWVEEAEKVSAYSWEVLRPTIRKENSEIWLTWNPESEKSATYKQFVTNPPPFLASAHLTYRDNYYFPEVLRQEMEYDRVVDPDKFDHVWEGKVKTYHDALIFAGKIYEEDFEAPEGVDFYYGLDFGFSNDPMAVNRMFIIDNELFIDYEFYARGVDIKEYSAALDTIPGIREGRIRADCSMPASISYLKGEGFDIIGEGKLQIEDGITYLRGFKRIVIHSRCVGALDDFKNYRFKQDKLTKEVLAIIVDKSNHVPDNVRYALRPLIKKKRSWGAA